MRNIIVPALAALSLAAVPTPSSAETVSIDVEYADLNLSNEAGMAALERRIERAIERICGDDNARQTFRLREQRRCAAQAKASANEQIARIVRNSTNVAVNR